MCRCYIPSSNIQIIRLSVQIQETKRQMRYDNVNVENIKCQLWTEPTSEGRVMQQIVSKFMRGRM